MYHSIISKICGKMKGKRRNETKYNFLTTGMCTPFPLESSVSSSQGSGQVCSAVDLQVEDMNYSNFTIIRLQVRN